MSKDFYSNNHKIQVGWPGTSSGDLSLDIEGDYNSEIKGDYNSEIIGDKNCIANRIEMISETNGGGITLRSRSGGSGITIGAVLQSVDISGGSLDLSSGLGDVNITSASDIAITSSGNLNVETEGTVSIQRQTSGLAMDISSTSSVMGGYIVKVTNTTTGATEEGILDLSFENIVTPDDNNKWIKFSSNGVTKGAVRASVSLSEVSLYTISGSTGFLSNTAGDVQYTSGNADFGEWIEIGDYKEWNISEDLMEEYKKSSILPVQEGVLLYIRESKAWKHGPGRGMVSTSRSVIVGNSNFKKDGKIGVIVSFIGQVPVLVAGKARDGDILIPMNNSNYCIAVDPSDISFKDYRSAIGTVWGNKSEDHIGYVNCAISIK